MILLDLQTLPSVMQPAVFTRARDVGVLFLVAVLVLLYGTSRFLARRTLRPAAILGPAIYFGILHVIALFGLVTSVRFENGIAQLTLFTFPFSMILYQETGLSGFATGHELLENYVRYILHFGGANTLILAVFFALVVPPRRRVDAKHAGAPRQAPLPPPKLEPAPR